MERALLRAAEHLFVFQRTPSYTDERGDVPTDPDWAATLQPGWQAERRRNFHTAAFEAFAPGQPDLICDAWTEVSRNLAAYLDATNGWAALASADKFMELREIQDYRAMQRQRDRIDGIVSDPETAEALKAYYRFLCRPTDSASWLLQARDAASTVEYPAGQRRVPNRRPLRQICRIGGGRRQR